MEKNESPLDLSGFAVQTLTTREGLEELNETMERWGREYNWSVAVQDTFLRSFLDPGATFAGKLNGEIVSMICAINYNDTYCYLGAFVTKEEYRGKGLGTQLMKAALRHAGNRTVALISNPQNVSRYAKDGFVSRGKTGYYIVENLKRFAKPNCPYLINATEVSADALSKCDRKYFPADRKEFLQGWIRLPKSIAFAYVKDGAVLGYGAIRKTTGDEAKLGPLYADTLEIAKDLAATLLHSMGEVKQVVFETLDGNRCVGTLTSDLEFRLLGNGEWMLRNGEPPSFDINGVYAYTSGVYG